MKFRNKKTGEIVSYSPVLLNAAKLSAQQRKRLFWIGKLINNKYEKVEISQPEDRGILLKDILESGEAVKEKAYCLTAHQKDFINDFITGGAKRTREGKGKTLEMRKDGKSNSLTTVSTDSLVVLKDYFRPLTPIECERLQGLPDNYSEGLSKTTRKKVLGNGFNCSVIKHILENML